MKRLDFTAFNDKTVRASCHLNPADGVTYEFLESTFATIHHRAVPGCSNGNFARANLRPTTRVDKTTADACRLRFMAVDCLTADLARRKIRRVRVYGAGRR